MGWGIWGFSHVERRADVVRFYAEYLEPGTYRLSHVSQVVIPGVFKVPTPRAEQMYSKDVFATGEEYKLTVTP
jgi:uncharacterized protein YfaS (alpha-2-macroglobulin family)